MKHSLFLIMAITIMSACGKKKKDGATDPFTHSVLPKEIKISDSLSVKRTHFRNRFYE